MAQDFIKKRQNIATTVVNATDEIMHSLTALQKAQLDLAQSGGGFEDSDFVGTEFAYLIAYPINVLLNISLPSVLSAFQTGTPKIDDIFRTVSRGLE